MWGEWCQWQTPFSYPHLAGPVRGPGWWLMVMGQVSQWADSGTFFWGSRVIVEIEVPVGRLVPLTSLRYTYKAQVPTLTDPIRRQVSWTARTSTRQRSKDRWCPDKLPLLEQGERKLGTPLGPDPWNTGGGGDLTNTRLAGVCSLSRSLSFWRESLLSWWDMALQCLVPSSALLFYDLSAIATARPESQTTCRQSDSQPMVILAFTSIQKERMKRRS